MESQKSYIEKQIEQSAEAFAQQFDPKSETYHGGDKRAVPIGGERIPSSMPTVYPEEVKNLDTYINTTNQVINYGEEYNQLLIQRETFLKMKKVLASFGAPLEAILRHRENFQTQGDASNPKHVQTFNTNIANELVKLKAAISDVTPLIQFTEQHEFKERYVGLREIVEQAGKEFQNQQDLTQYNFNIKKYSSSAFNDAGQILDKMKQIKKEFEKGTKTTTTSTTTTTIPTSSSSTTDSTQQEETAPVSSTAPKKEEEQKD